MTDKNKKNLWLHSLITALISLGLSCACFHIFDITVLENPTQQGNSGKGTEEAANFFYKIENRTAGERSFRTFFDDNIVIFDLQGTPSRGEIADAIGRIADCNPRMIALDIIFPKASQTDYLDNVRLESVISSHADKIVAAARLTDRGLERSFFVQRTGTPEGLANRTFALNPYEIVGVDTLWRLPWLAAEVKDTPDSRRLVNYFDKAFHTVAISDTLIREEIEGRIVIVGDLDDLRDTHDMPFRIDGSYRVPGTVIIAHTVSSILNDSWVVRVRGVWAILIAFIVGVLYARFCYLIRGKDGLADVWEEFLENASRIALILITMLAIFLLFSSAGILVNLAYTMFVLALTGFSSGLVRICYWLHDKTSVKLQTGKQRKKAAGKNRTEK